MEISNLKFRLTREEILTKRRKNQNVILLTGISGFLGGHLAAELIKQNKKVIVLCRLKARNNNICEDKKSDSDSDSDIRSRVENILNWHQLTLNDCKNLDILKGELTQDKFSLEKSEFRKLVDSVDEIIHIAASTSFADSKKEEIKNANILALNNLITFARESKCYFFHHVSTAYACGKIFSDMPVEEKLIDNLHFNNYYEESKNIGEKILIENCKNEGIRWNIIRPSITYGHSQTGRTHNFNALYYPVRIIHYLKTLCEKEFLKNGGTNTKEMATMGIKVLDNGKIFMQLRVAAAASDKGTIDSINLIPVDYFVNGFKAIMEDSIDIKGDNVYHLVNDHSPSLEELLNYTKKFFNIDGIVIEKRPSKDCDLNKMDRFFDSPNALEILFERYINIYKPYMLDSRKFENYRTKKILNKYNIICPIFDYQIFEKCMKYALEVDWGKNCKF
ncbi:MAG: SDR family oxidoreductase [Oligoflexia bacterium]|nr:SDR family oxidoreductase [Oligoflexia bacterium]